MASMKKIETFILVEGDTITATVGQDPAVSNLIIYIIMSMAGNPMTDLRSITDPLTELRTISIVYSSPVTRRSFHAFE